MSPWRTNRSETGQTFKLRIFQAFSSFCQLYCENDFIDLCDTRDLPGGLGDLNTRFPIGRFWRFQVAVHIDIAGEKPCLMKPTP